jgi:signal transduction histidine kinase
MTAPPSDDDAAVEVLRNAAVGRLVSAVAHELNNPVHIVAGNVEFLAQYLGGLLELAAALDEGADPARLAAVKERIEYEYLKKDAPRLLAAVREAASRLTVLVKDLRTFTRAPAGDDVERQRIELDALVDSALNVLAPMYKNRLVVERELPRRVPAVISREGHVHQAVLAVLAAVAESAPGGKVVIRLAEVEGGVRLEVRARLTRGVFDQFSRRILAAHGAILEEQLGDEGRVAVTFPLPSAGG